MNKIYYYIYIVFFCSIAFLYADPNDIEVITESDTLTLIDHHNAKIKQDYKIESAVSNKLLITKKINLDNITVIDNDNKDDVIEEVLLQAISLMGIPYKWGGNTPTTGMDCSGFIRYLFNQTMGIELPRTVAQMSTVGKKINIQDIKPGDLIFFNTLRGRRNSHIGMYIGNNEFIHSPRTGDAIKITYYNSYWRSHTNGIKRIMRTVIDENGGSQIQSLTYIRNESLPTSKIIIKKSHHHKKNKIMKHNTHKTSNTHTHTVKNKKMKHNIHHKRKTLHHASTKHKH